MRKLFVILFSAIILIPGLASAAHINYGQLPTVGKELQMTEEYEDFIVPGDRN